MCLGIAHSEVRNETEFREKKFFKSHPCVILCPLWVWNEFPKVFSFALWFGTKFLFFLSRNGSERKAKHFCLPRSGLEQNYEVLFYEIARNEIPSFSSSAEMACKGKINQNFRSVFCGIFFYSENGNPTSVHTSLNNHPRVSCVFLKKNFLCLSAVCPSMAFRVPPVAPSFLAHIFHASAQPITNIVRQIIKNIITNRTTLHSRFPIRHWFRSRENEPVAEIISHIFILFRS